MKFEQPREFLELCERLKTKTPAFESAKKIMPDYRTSEDAYCFCGYAFEYLVKCTVARLAEKYDAQPLQKADEHLLAPFALSTKALNRKKQYRLVLGKKQVAELDITLRFDEDQLWVFESKTGWPWGDLHTKPMLKKSHHRVFADIAQNGTKISYAYVTPKAAYDARFREPSPRTLEEIAEHNIVATYLSVTHEQIIEFTKVALLEREKRKAQLYAR
jgi:hypothetical protein